MAARWSLFVAGTLLLLVLVLWLASQTARYVRTTSEVGSPGVEADGATGDSAGVDAGSGRSARTLGHPDMGGTVELLASATLSQVLLVTALGGLAWYASVPIEALNLGASRSVLLPGLALGAGLYLVGEAGVRVVEHLGLEVDETLVALLAPETPLQFAILLLGVLPAVAVGEELLFRGALIGAFAVGLSVSPWLLVVFSSIAFGLGHGLQGPGGVLVTAVLGLCLGAAFVITESLALVIVAHYVVNALEFLTQGLDAGETSGFR